LLVYNIEQNGYRHVVAENLGLAETASYLTGTADLAGGNWSFASRGDFRFEVQLVRLDDYLREHPLPRIDAIKIDVEGAEVRVLRGAREMIERFRPLIIFEVCPAWLEKLGTSPGELFGELTGHSYAILPLDGSDVISERRVKLGDLAGLGPAAFVNLVAVPSDSSRLQRLERTHSAGQEEAIQPPQPSAG
jgi:FkbM family methyltransferase